MGAPITMWIGNDGHIRFQINRDAPDGERIDQFFEVGFNRRDTLYGTSPWRRKEGSAYVATWWQLAETFFSHFTSTEFATLLEKYSEDPESPQETRVLENVRNLDSFFDYGYVFDSQRRAQRWNFWQIYAPHYSTEELKKIIPNVFQSKTRARDHPLPAHTSPPLIGSRKEQAIAKLQEYGGVKKPDEVALHLMGYQRDPTHLDILKSRFYRRWAHPMIILNRTLPTRARGVLPVQTTEEYVLDILSLMYPVLNNSRVSNSGRPKDFTLEYIALS